MLLHMEEGGELTEDGVVGSAVDLGRVGDECHT